MLNTLIINIIVLDKWQKKILSGSGSYQIALKNQAIGLISSKVSFKKLPGS